VEPARPGSGSQPKVASRLVWAGLVGVLGVVAVAGLLSLGRRAASPPGASLGGLQVLGEVPDFRLVERSGREIGLEDLRGRVWIADFVFTRCGGICPVLSARMARLQESLGVAGDSGLRLVSFTVDPAHDTPEVLRAYADALSADAEGWLFLTGARADLHTLIKDGFRLSVAERDPGDPEADPNEMITHSDRFVLVDSQARIRGYYHGTEEESVDRLLADLDTLRKRGG
jgi:protein SCO1/2